MPLWLLGVLCRIWYYHRPRCKCYDHTCINTLAGNNNAFFVEIMSTLKAIKSPFGRSYDKQNITLVVISYENQTSLPSFDEFHMKRSLVLYPLFTYSKLLVSCLNEVIAD